MSLAHGRQHSWLWLWDLPQPASPGLPGRSKTWGRGCRRGGIYTSGSGTDSPHRTGTWAQRRERHTSQDLYVPKAESLRLYGLAKHALIVGEATLKHSGRADLVKNSAPFSPSPQEVESLWPPPF